MRLLVFHFNKDIILPSPALSIAASLMVILVNDIWQMSPGHLIRIHLSTRAAVSKCLLKAFAVCCYLCNL